MKAVKVFLKLELGIINTIGGKQIMNDNILKIGNYEFNSRLIVGSGKYKDFQTTKEATLASGSELITVAIRRVNITNPNEENLLDYFKDTNIKLLPNSAGCFTAEEAITTFRLMREATG